MKNQKWKKSVLSILLCATLMLGLLPQTASAYPGDDGRLITDTTKKKFTYGTDANVVICQTNYAPIELLRTDMNDDSDILRITALSTDEWQFRSWLHYYDGPIDKGENFEVGWTGRYYFSTKDNKMTVEKEGVAAGTYYVYAIYTSTVNVDADAGVNADVSGGYEIKHNLFTYNSTEYGAQMTITWTAPAGYRISWDGWNPQESLTLLFQNTGPARRTVVKTANEQTFVFNANGYRCTGTTPSQIIRTDEGYSLNPNGFTRIGYIFKGWNTKADGSGKNYSDQYTQQKPFVERHGTTVTLYAQWEKCQAHNWRNGNGKCVICGSSCTHSSNLPATCLKGAYCCLCGITYSEPLPHNYVYSAEACTLVERCENGCGHERTAILQVKSGADLTYTGSAVTPLEMVYPAGWVGEQIQPAEEDYFNNTDAGTASCAMTYAEGATVTQNFTIATASMPTINVHNYYAVYDGNPHGITIDVPEGAIIMYGTTEGDYALEQSPTLTNVGSMVVYYQVTHPNYDTVTGSVPVIIMPAVVEVVPRDGSMVYGDEMPEILFDAMTGIDAETPAFTGTLAIDGTDAGTYQITLGSLALTDSGNFKASNYTIELASEGVFEILKAEGSASVSIENWVYGDAAATPVPISSTNGTENVTYLYKVKGTDDATYTDSVPTQAGEYTVKASFAATNNYNETTATADFEITKRTITITDAVVDDLIYNAEGNYAMNVTDVTFGNLASGDVLTLGTDYTATAQLVSNTASATAPAAITVTLNRDNYTLETPTFIGTVTLNKADAVLTDPVAGENLTYSGTAQELVSAGSTTGGELWYRLDDDYWDSEIPKATNAGEYTVWYRVLGGSNYNDISSASVTVVIDPRSVTAPEFVGLDARYPHTGETITPAFALKDDLGNVIPADEYTVTYSDNTAVGTATITIEDNDGGNYTVSGTTTFEIVPKPITAPEISVTLNSSDRPVIRWTAVEDAEKYELYSAVDGGEFELLGTLTGTKVTHNSAIPGTTYSYKVRAVAGENKSEFSEVVTITVPAKITLTAPTLTVKNNASTGKIVLSWTKVDGAKQYEIWRSAKKDGEYTLLTTTADLTLTDAAAAGETYYYKVRAMADGIEGEFSEIVGKTCDLARPTVTAANDPATGKPTLTWEAVPGADKYEVYVATSKTGTYTKLGSVTGTTATHKAATAGETYYYRVKAIYAANSGANSAASVAVGKTCDLARPTITVTNNEATGKPVITWKAITGATGYELWASTSKDGTYTKLGTVTGITATHKGATAGKTYYYKVRAIMSGNSGATSAASAAVGKTCDLARPVVTITLNAKGKPVLSWKAVDGAIGYEIYASTSVNGSYIKLGTVTGTTATHNSAASGKTYYYKVRAICKVSGGNSAYSEIQSVTVE